MDLQKQTVYAQVTRCRRHSCGVICRFADRLLFGMASAKVSKPEWLKETPWIENLMKIFPYATLQP